MQSVIKINKRIILAAVSTSVLLASSFGLQVAVSAAPSQSENPQVATNSAPSTAENKTAADRMHGSVTVQIDHDAKKQKGSGNLEVEADPNAVNVTRDESCAVGQALKLPVSEWSVSGLKTKAIILAIHGATLYGGVFDPVARHLAAQGYPVFALDMRGYGRWRFENEKYGGDNKIHYTQSREDIINVLAEINKTYPGTPVYCLGESVGANLALWTAADRPDLVTGAVMSSPCTKRILHPCPRMLVDVIQGFRNPYAPHDLQTYIRPYLSSDKRVGPHYVADPMMNYHLSAADLIKTVKTNELALLEVGKIPENMPLLIVAGKKDKIYKSNAIAALMKSIGSHKTTVHIEPKKGHLLLETPYYDKDTLDVIDGWLDNVRDQAKISER